MSTTIEPDADVPTRERSSGPVSASSADLESGSHPTQGLTDILRQSAHPVALFVLYLLRIAAIATYILCGFFTDNYVVSTVIVVVLLAMDFWNCRNVAGRTLVGLRFWNQVDDDGESYWIFESRDPSRPANPVDSRLFWTALYVFPALWLGLFFVSLLKFNLSFVPIVVLALVFNVTNVIGFTYADRDAKKRWAQSIVSSSWSIGGLGGQMLTGVVKNGVGRVFGS
ncbi:hypothetical protein EDB84DRAFT_1505557 [Lactarius hengduanensis]|nr:hypothetical protein EDB84DRAFT_1505557 [Lactarius hengduanensis]